MALEQKIFTYLDRFDKYDEYSIDDKKDWAKELHSLFIEEIEKSFVAASERLDKPVLVKKVGDVTHWSWMKYQNATDYINSIDT